MKLSKLQRCHDEYDALTLRTYHDLVAGGVQFQKNVADYLPKHDVEPRAVYAKRCASAHYLGYISPIVNYYASWLFSSALTFEADPVENDEFWDEFKEDCTGTGIDLDQFLRARFIDAVTGRSAFWRIEMPDPNGIALDSIRQFAALGLGRARLHKVPARHITNWKRDETGAWEWVIEHECKTALDSIEDDTAKTTETWTLWNRDGTAKRWSVTYDADKKLAPKQDVPEVDPPYNPCRGIPILELRMPDELWIVNHLASGQLEHFRKSNALSWSIDRTCYAMPYFFLEDPKRPPTQGAGYYGILGVDEKVEWVAPPATPFQAVGDYIAKIKDELHRISHQMALGVDNNAAAIGRSGESKNSDNAATEIVLSAFGRILREPVEQTFDLISAARAPEGSKPARWYVGGMDTYRLPDAATILANATLWEALKIPSVTAHREVAKRATLAMLPDADEGTRALAVKEIEDGISAEEQLPDPIPPQLPNPNAPPGTIPAPPVPQPPPPAKAKP